MSSGLDIRPVAVSVRARVATIVAGGALGTPELLLRSGLGGRQAGRNLHIHPACWVGARYAEEVRGWDGIMQSYYVDEWERERLLLEATFTPLAFGGAWLPGAGREHQPLDARLRPHRLDRRPPLRRLQRPRLAGRRRLPQGSLQAHSHRRRPPHIRNRSCGRNTLRRRRRRGLSQHRPCGQATPERLPSSSRPASSLQSCASRLSTRWAPHGSPLTKRWRLRPRRLRQRHQRSLRRRRLALPNLSRRQSDDDRDRLRFSRIARRPRGKGSGPGDPSQNGAARAAACALVLGGVTRPCPTHHPLLVASRGDRLRRESWCLPLAWLGSHPRRRNSCRQA